MKRYSQSKLPGGDSLYPATRIHATRPPIRLSFCKAVQHDADRAFDLSQRLGCATFISRATGGRQRISQSRKITRLPSRSFLTARARRARIVSMIRSWAVRGQLEVLMPQPEIGLLLYGPGYMFPRPLTE